MTARPPPGTETGRLLLEQIAAKLDLPVGMFFDAKPEKAATEQAGSTLAEQLLVLADRFKRIDDPRVRAECLDFVQKRIGRCSKYIDKGEAVQIVDAGERFDASRH